MHRMTEHPAAEDAKLAMRLAGSNIRVTDQRLRIARVLLRTPQHLTAERVAELLRREGDRVSKATVYNTLNLFASRGIIRQLNVDNERAWFDSTVEPHFHFYDESTGTVFDLPPPGVQFSCLPPAPEGMEYAGLELVIRLRRRAS